MSDGQSRTGPLHPITRRARAGFCRRDTLTSMSLYGLGRLTGLVEQIIQVPVVLVAAAFAPIALAASSWWDWILAIVSADLA